MAIIPLQTELSNSKLNPICIITSNDDSCNSSAIFLFLNSENQEVLYRVGGATLHFSLLPWKYKKEFYYQLINDIDAYNAVKHLSIELAIEKYILVLYGNLNSTVSLAL